jgi:hypothetical protein
MIVGELTPTYVRETYLRGVDLGQAWSGAGADAALTVLIQTWIEAAQGKLGIQFRRQRVLTYPDADKVFGVDYEIQGEPLTYFRAQPGAQHFVIPLPFANVQSIERVRIFYGNPVGNPQAHWLYEVPAEWILFTQKEGILRINPSITNAVLQTQFVGGGTAGFDSVYYTFYHREAIPGSWAIDYTIGYGQIPLDVAQWIGLNVAMQTLGMAGAGVDVGHGLGSESLSMDGITESISYGQGEYGPYSGLIKTYKDALECLNIGQLKARYHGIKVAVF